MAVTRPALPRLHPALPRPCPGPAQALLCVLWVLTGQGGLALIPLPEVPLGERPVSGGLGDCQHCRVFLARLGTVPEITVILYSSAFLILVTEPLSASECHSSLCVKAPSPFSVSKHSSSLCVTAQLLSLCVKAQPPSLCQSCACVTPSPLSNLLCQSVP